MEHPSGNLAFSLSIKIKCTYHAGGCAGLGCKTLGGATGCVDRLGPAAGGTHPSTIQHSMRPGYWREGRFVEESSPWLNRADPPFIGPSRIN